MLFTMSTLHCNNLKNLVKIRVWQLTATQSN